MEDNQRAAVQGLIDAASGKLDLAWTYAPIAFGGKAFGLSLGNVDYGRAYIHAADDWIVARDTVMSEIPTNDPDPIIDRLAAVVDRVVQRRNQLANLGFDNADPLTDATKEFIEAFREQLRKVIALVKEFVGKYLPNKDDVDKYGSGVLIALALIALIVVFK